MQVQTYILIIAVAFLVGAGCAYDSFEEVVPAEERDPVSFSDEIQPMFSANCTASGCHVSGGYAPVLTEGEAYDELMAMDLVNVDEPEKSGLYKWMDNTSQPMPPSGRMDEDTLQMVLAWIEQGAEDN